MRRLSRKQLQQETKKYQSKYPHLKILRNESTISLKVKYDEARRLEGKNTSTMKPRRNDRFSPFREAFYRGELIFS